MAKYELSKVFEIADGEVGYLEKRSNSNLDSKTGNAGQNNYTKYWRDLGYSGYQGQPWCQAFICWLFLMAFGAEAGKKLLHMKRWEFYTPTASSLFKNAGQWHSSPKAGDIIYFRNSSRICHVGIVRKVADGTVYTIEGNTSNGSSVIANGGGVCKKSYSIGNSRIAGYGRPAYTDTKVSSGSSTGTSSDKEIVRRGQRNANTFLKNHRANPPQIEEDGVRGMQTRKQCVRVVQTALNLDNKAGLAVDGVIGPKTKAALKGKTIKKGDKKYLVVAAKILYQCNGRDKGLKYTRTFGNGLQNTAGKTKITESDFLALLK